jgi:hypothetical protein
MPNFDIYRGMITAFEVDDICLFKLYFDQGDMFGDFKYYYSGNKSRLEVQDDNTDDVRQILDEYFYFLRIKDGLHSYFVVNQKDTKYSGIQNSVLTNRRSDYITILMSDQLLGGQAHKYGRRRFRRPV